LRRPVKTPVSPYGQKIPGGVVFKDIRRTVKTFMAEVGVDKVFRDTVLGHRLEGMDRHYIVPSEESLTKAMSRYTEFLDKQLSDTSANEIEQFGENTKD